MKRYLNRQEKNDFYILAAFMIFMEDSITNWTKAGKDKELLKSARTCRTYANKVATMFISSLDDLEKTKLIYCIAWYNMIIAHQLSEVKEGFHGEA